MAKIPAQLEVRKMQLLHAITASVTAPKKIIAGGKCIYFIHRIYIYKERKLLPNTNNVHTHI